MGKRIFTRRLVKMTMYTQLPVVCFRHDLPLLSRCWASVAGSFTRVSLEASLFSIRAVYVPKPQVGNTHWQEAAELMDKMPRDLHFCVPGRDLVVAQRFINDVIIGCKSG